MVTKVFVQVIVPSLAAIDNEIIGEVLSKVTSTTFEEMPVAHPLAVFVTTTL